MPINFDTWLESVKNMDPTKATVAGACIALVSLAFWWFIKPKKQTLKEIREIVDEHQYLIQSPDDELDIESFLPNHITQIEGIKIVSLAGILALRIRKGETLTFFDYHSDNDPDFVNNPPEIILQSHSEWHGTQNISNGSKNPMVLSYLASHLHNDNNSAGLDLNELGPGVIVRWLKNERALITIIEQHHNPKEIIEETAYANHGKF